MENVTNLLSLTLFFIDFPNKIISERRLNWQQGQIEAQKVVNSTWSNQTRVCGHWCIFPDARAPWNKFEEWWQVKAQEAMRNKSQHDKVQRCFGLDSSEQRYRVYKLKLLDFADSYEKGYI